MRENICTMCPRKCGVDRNRSVGFCGAPSGLKVALVKKHFGEEPIISGTKGSGTIFFSHCNLKCVFCQNYEISSEGKGKGISVARLVEIFKELEQNGVHNINLVSPSQYAMQLLEAFRLYKPQIPVVYNTNGYDDVDTLKLLAPYIDIYLTDLKFCDSDLSKKYCNCSNYFDVATRAIKQMRLNVPEDVIEKGVMKRGLIVRHLVMPECTNDSIKVLDWVADNLGKDTIVSLMCQYVPYYKSCEFSEINRTLKPLEYKRVYNYMVKLGLDKGYCQQLDSATTEEIPSWTGEGV